ncbi:MAG: DUF1467 family protein [Alphaproteobacteria bacterium]|nr:DUF1467 family protein [Alphaproteobacteria bacterium]
MSWLSGIVVFVMIWWTAIFTVLPWGLKRDERGMPDDPRLKQKILMTTLISAALWLVVYALIEADIISFREIARGIMEKDRPL